MALSALGYPFSCSGDVMSNSYALAESFVRIFQTQSASWRRHLRARLGFPTAGPQVPPQSEQTVSLFGDT